MLMLVKQRLFSVWGKLKKAEDYAGLVQDDQMVLVAERMMLQFVVNRLSDL